MTGGAIGWFFPIIAGVALLLLSFHKKSYEKSAELYGAETANKKFKMMRYLAYILLALSVVGLILQSIL